MIMPKAYTVTKEMVKEIREEMSNAKTAKEYKRLLAAALRGEGKSNHKSAEITGYNPDYVAILVSKYVRNGLKAIAAYRKTHTQPCNL
jgi:hypothetical protein